MRFSGTACAIRAEGDFSLRGAAMDNPTSPINPSKEELELLSPSLAASLCCVSEARFNSWIEQGFMPLLDYKGAKMVRSSDLIGHLVTYNIRIPARLLDQGQKKILCIMQGSALDAETVTYLIRYLYLVRKKENCIIDFTKHGEHAELKVLTFEPDRIILLGKREEVEILGAGLKKLISPRTTIIHLSPRSSCLFLPELDSREREPI